MSEKRAQWGLSGGCSGSRAAAKRSAPPCRGAAASPHCPTSPLEGSRAARGGSGRRAWYQPPTESLPLPIWKTLFAAPSFQRRMGRMASSLTRMTKRGASAMQTTARRRRMARLRMASYMGKREGWRGLTARCLARLKRAWLAVRVFLSGFGCTVTATRGQAAHPIACMPLILMRPQVRPCSWPQVAGGASPAGAARRRGSRSRHGVAAASAPRWVGGGGRTVHRRPAMPTACLHACVPRWCRSQAGSTLPALPCSPLADCCAAS